MRLCIVFVPRGDGDIIAPLTRGEESIVPVPRDDGERIVVDLRLSAAARS